ncbi:MAG: hypothetical protein AABZ39_00735 [Spirochaetota bacterium]
MGDAIIKRLIPYSIALGAAAVAAFVVNAVFIPPMLRVSVAAAVAYSMIVIGAMFFLKFKALSSDPQTAFFLVFASVFLNILSVFMLLGLGTVFALNHPALLLAFAAFYPLFYMGLALFVFGVRKNAE